MAELHPQIARAFAAAALAPGLRKVLILDAPPELLPALAEALAEALTISTGQPVDQLNLAAAQSEDDLWGGMALDPTEPGAIRWQPGLLTGELASPERIPLVYVPNLADVSTIAQRALVTLLDTPTAMLERHGQHRTWQPQISWLAACTSDEAAKISAHLLDRFTLRIDGQGLAAPDRQAELLELIQDQEQKPQVFHLPVATVETLRAALGRPPLPADSRLTTLIAEMFPYAPEQASLRRALARARLEIALARLDGTATIDELLRIIRLGITINQPPAGAGPGAQRQQPGDQPLDTRDTASSRTAHAPGEQRAGVGELVPGGELSPVAPDAVAQPGDIQPGDAPEPIELQLRLYPEDRPQREASDPLRLPPRRFSASASASGPIIGVMPADSPHDLAMVATLIEAAKWRRLRRTLRPDLADRALLVWPGDLRRYRRAPVVEQLLMLVVDYTCRTGYDWGEAIFPHILWAYRERAGVFLIQVGSDSSAQSLQAQQTQFSNVLVPQLSTALNEGSGWGTPLAHGLDLATQTLRRMVHGGRSAVQRARLVVLSDGRGNIPLEASRGGELRGPIGRRGIDDALATAPALASLHHVERLLIAPEPRLHPEAAQRLAAALQAPLWLMPALEIARSVLSPPAEVAI